MSWGIEYDLNLFKMFERKFWAHESLATINAHFVYEVVSSKRQIGVNPVFLMQLFIETVWSSSAVSRAWKQTNVRNKRKIFCLVTRSFYFSIHRRSFSCCRRFRTIQFSEWNEWKQFFFIQESVSFQRERLGGLMMKIFMTKEIDDESKHVSSILESNVWLFLLLDRL